MSDKRYQVFVSSTYADLKEERQEVMHTLLQIDCFPSAMELFPSADTQQMDFIKKIIDDCDYYILIVGGRYGSMTDAWISFTEAEYDYAKEKGVPVLAFLHREPGEIPQKNTDNNDEKRRKLDKFKEKIQEKALVTYWRNKDDLGKQVVISMNKAFETHERPGWIRSDSVGQMNQTLKPLAIADVPEIKEGIKAVYSGIAALDRINSNRLMFTTDPPRVELNKLYNAYPHFSAEVNRAIRKSPPPIDSQFGRLLTTEKEILWQFAFSEDEQLPYNYSKIINQLKFQLKTLEDMLDAK